MASDMTVTPTIKGSDMVMADMGGKLKHGYELTFSEGTSAISITASQQAYKYGPGPANMTVTPPSLPESVVGNLLSYAT